MICLKFLMLLLLVAFYNTLASAITCRHSVNATTVGSRRNEDTISCKGVCYASLELNGEETRILTQGCDDIIEGEHFDTCKEEKECKLLNVGKDNKNKKFCCCIADLCNSSQYISAEVSSLFGNATTIVIQPDGESGGGWKRWKQSWNTKSILLFHGSCLVIFVVCPFWVYYNCYKRSAHGTSCQI